MRKSVARLLLALLGCGCAVASAQVRVGEAFPPLADPALVRLGEVSLPATAGQVVLVDFWASWCAPCKASFPVLAKLQREYGSRGLVIAAVGIDEKSTAATAFVQKLAPPFPTLHDRAQKLVKQVVVPTMPTTYLVGRDGRLRFVHEGFHGERSEREIRLHLEKLLAEKP
jgi:thiol-disulfide isomerase/thioredoxin